MGIASILLLIAAAAGVPPQARELPAQSVDHVATMEVRESGCLSCRDHRSTIIRSGSWIREERTYPDRIEIRFSDFESGTSILFARDLEGAVLLFSVERAVAQASWRDLRRESTGNRDSALGETCEIWAIRGEYRDLESCETADGIVLWTRNPGNPDLGTSRAVSIERRSVDPAKVRPPRDLFTLAPWPHLSAVLPEDMGYEVELTSNTRGSERTDLRRRQGHVASGWHEGRHDEGTIFWAGDGTNQFSYAVDVEGRALSLSVQRSDYGFRLDGGGRWEGVPGRRPESLLGELCTWQDETSIRSTDIHLQCRTVDGVPLMLEHDWHWDDTTDVYRARRVIRRQLAAADLAPPPEATQWATWGIDPSELAR